MKDFVYVTLRKLCTNDVKPKSLRVHKPVGLPRIAPPGGGVVSGYRVPEGTFVSVHPLTLSRSPKMFRDPDAFHPERWIAGNDSIFSADVRNAVQAFSVGPH